MRSSPKKNLYAVLAIASVFAIGIATSLFLAGPRAHADDTSCKVTEIKIDPSTDWSTAINADGNMIVTGPKWYTRDYHGPVKITVNGTSNCAGLPVYISLMGSDTESVPVLDSKKLTFPESNSIDITLRSGEDLCHWLNDPECHYWVIAGSHQLDGGDASLETNNDLFSSRGRYAGEMKYDCHEPSGGTLSIPTSFTDALAVAGTALYDELGKTSCDGDTSTGGSLWSYVSDTSMKDPSNPVRLADGAFTTGIDPNSACKGDTSGKCYALFSGFADAIGDSFSKLENTDSLGGFLNAVIAFGIGIGGVIAVAMIVYEGFLYMRNRRDGNPVKMSESLTRIGTTVFGLVLLLLIYATLKTINPDLLNLTPSIDSVTFDTGGDTSTPVSAQTAADLKNNASTYGVNCPGSGGTAALSTIAQSFVGKVNYELGAKGSFDGKYLHFDCSGFVATVYTCAGLPYPGSGTGGIFSGASLIIPPVAPTQVNGTDLKPGDLLGWTAGSLTNGKAEKNGHVIMYIGNGSTIESTSGNGGKRNGNGVQVRASNAYGDRLKLLKQAPQ